MKNKYTKHGKKRINQRINTNVRASALITSVKKYGKTKDNYKGTFYNYLKEKEDNSKSKIICKVHNNNIFIFSSCNHKLITTYPVPEGFLPLEKFEIPKTSNKLTHDINGLAQWIITVEFKDGRQKTGYIRGCNIDKSSGNIRFKLIEDGKKKMIKLENVKSLSIAEQIFSEDLKTKYLSMVENINQLISDETYKDFEILQKKLIIKK